VSAAAAATEKASEGLTALVRDGNADAVDPTAIDRAIEQTTAAHRVLGPALDRLIETRIIRPILAGRIPLSLGIDAIASARAAALADPEGEALTRCLAEIDQHGTASIAAE